MFSGGFPVFTLALLVPALFSSVTLYLYFFKRHYAFSHSFATSARCNTILDVLKKKFSGRYTIPVSHVTPYHAAKASYTASAISIKYDVTKVSAHDNPNDFCHVAVTNSFVDIVTKQLSLRNTIDLAILLPPFGGTQYMRTVRRVVFEIENAGIPVACLLDRNTTGYDYPYECEPLRNSYLDHRDAYLTIEFLVRVACIMHMGDFRRYNFTQQQLLQYAALWSDLPAKPEVPADPGAECLARSGFNIRFHIVGYSLGAMRITHILIDKDLDKTLADITKRVSSRYLYSPSHIGLRLELASAAFGYATFDLQAPLNHPKGIQRMLAKHLIQEIHKNPRKKEYLLKHLSAKVENPEKTLEKAIGSGLLSDLDANISCALYGFETYADYYKELLPTNRIHLFSPRVPVLFINTQDDFITGSKIPIDEIKMHPQAIFIKINRGGHLGTVLSDGRDLCSQIIAEWLGMQRG